MPYYIKNILFFLIIAILTLTSITSGQSYPESKEGFIEVTGGKIWYKIYGSGDQNPLLLLHGGPGGRSCMLTPIREISDQRPVIFYDQLGSGKSDRPDDTTLWHLERFVDELDRLIDSLQLNKVHILGHSWGSSLAIEYFLMKKPEKVKSLILAGPLFSTNLWIEDANYLRAQLPDSIQKILSYHEKIGSVYSEEYLSATEYFYNKHLYRKRPIPKFEECDIGNFNEVIYEQMWGPSEFFCSGNLLNYNRIDRLNEIDVPVLLLIGEYDEVRKETMKRIQQLFPNAQLEIIYDAAHMTMVDQSEEFNRVVREFINSND